MTVIIGLLGPAGAGKSSVAEYLAEKYGARRYSLAAPLKEIARRVLDFSPEQLYGTQEQKETKDPRYGFSARWFLQKLGTDGCRAVMGDDIWTRTCLGQIERDAPELAVIEDVRFVNEATAIDSWTNQIGDPRQHAVDSGDIGHVWKLFPPADSQAATREASAGAHSSETEWREARAGYEIHPAARGLGELFGLVETACAIFGLVRK